MLDSLVRDTAKVLTGKTKETKPYDTTAEVVRIEGNTAWVHISGGVSETPVDMTISAKAGDQVNVRVSGGKAWITGNGSAPPTDDATAVKAQTTATEAKTVADSAQADASRASVAADSAEASAISAQQSATAASEAAAVADGKAVQAKNAADAAKAQAQNASEYASRALGNLSTVQSVSETLTWITQHGTMTLTSDQQLDPTHVYFVVDANGDYVVGSTHYSVVTEPDVDDISTYYELRIDESLNNYVGTHLALTQEGLWLLPASSGTNKVLIATGAGSTYTTAGTYILNSGGGVEASFRSNGATIGQVLNGYSRTEIGTDGMRIAQRASGSDTEIAQLGYGSGNAKGGGTAYAPYYTIGERATPTNVGNYSVAGGLNTDAKGAGATAFGYNSGSNGSEIIATGLGAMVFGDASQGGSVSASNDGAFAHGTADKGNLLASGKGSHAEGDCSDYGGIKATGKGSHAEGLNYSTSPSNYSIASGDGSHVEGGYCQASGAFAHAEGFFTKASSNYQHAQGKYSVEDTNNTYAVIVGNGTADNARSNALTVDWSGNVNIASGAKYKINGNNLSASDVGAVPTTRKVNNKALSSDITLTASDVSAVALADKYTRSSAGSLDWTNQTDGDAKIIAKSALAFWNGAYSGNSSNLSKCSTGSIVGTNGATMTGQLKTSFKTSVAMGSYGSSQTTVDGLAGEIRYSSGAAGSASINTAYTKSGVTIPTGWYNFFYMPHRSGGNSGAADGDNHQYGNLFLFGMNNTNGQFIVRVSSGSVAEVVKLVHSNSTMNGLFKVVPLTITTTAQISAHGYMAGATYTVPAADRPSGMTLVGVVGTSVSNFRLYCSTIYVNGDHSIYATVANASATAVATGATITPRLLYMKATSA